MDERGASARQPTWRHGVRTVAVATVGLSLVAGCDAPTAPPPVPGAPAAPAATPVAPDQPTPAPRPEPAKRNIDDAVNASLDWLVTMQNADGSWGADGDVAATGLALVAFIDGGEVPSSHGHGPHVKRGVDYLISVQAEDGSISSHERPDHVLRHAAAALALAEAWGMGGRRRLRPPAQSAVTYAAQLEPTNAREAFLLAVVAKSGAMSEFDSPEPPAPPPPEAGDDLMASVTALVARIYARTDRTAADDAAIDRHTAEWASLCDDTADPWTQWAGSIVIFGDSYEQLQAWRLVTYPRLLASQVRDGAATGSWPTADGVGTSTPDVATTALRCLVGCTAYRHNAFSRGWGR